MLAGVYLLVVLWGPVPALRTWLGVSFSAVSSPWASRRSGA